jgi:hypothetical protein
MDILNLVIGFLFGIPASIIGAYFYIKISNRAGSKHLRGLFNLGSDEVIFVFTHGGFVSQSILPRTSTEAFIAVNNLIGTLIRTGWKGPIRVRDTSRISMSDKTKNLVIVTGPKSNSFAGEVLANIKQQVPSSLDFQKVSEHPERWQILSDIYICPSPSYEQESVALNEGKEIATQKLDDVAMILKVTNPWNGANKIFIVAGVRGIGTWGAAEYLRKHADELYRAKSGSGMYKKDGNFAALLKVTYENYDIVRVELRQLIDIS